MDIEVRPVGVEDHQGWSALWAGYLAFYETDLDDATTQATWARLLAAQQPDVIGLVAVDGDDCVGLVHVVVHPTTWSTGPAAYLEDLFVAPDRRGAGIGRLLIDAVAERGREAGWSQVHWITAALNEPARQLYRRIATETDWVRYEIDLAPAAAGADPRHGVDPG